jgi:hypothetical protein
MKNGYSFILRWGIKQNEGEGKKENVLNRIKEVNV